MKEDYNCSIKSSCFGLKSLQLCLLFLLYGSGVFAQVTIPTANTNTTSNRKPFGSFFGFERTAAIYTAAEHGMTPGSTVTSVCFYVNAVTTPDDVPVVIYMATTTATAFTASTYASEIAGATSVFSGTITGASLVADSWRCVTLTTPFTYTGDNLKVIVETNYGGAGNEGVAAKQFRWSAGASQTWQADTAAPTGTGTISTTTRPNAQLNFTPPVGPGTLAFSAATFNGNEGTSAVVTVNRVGGATGAVSVNFATSNGTATSGLDYTTTNGILNWTNGDFAAKTISIPLTTDVILDPNETITLTLSNPTGTTITGTNPATLTVIDIPPPLTGTYTVGTGGNFTSLTNAGGIFEALNISGASSNITINIISDITGELGTNALNEISGGFTTLIKPIGGARTVTGSNIGALIKLNGCDGVTINGSTAGSTVATCLIGGDATLRELTFVNTNVGTAAVVLSVQSGVNGASNNTIKNVNIVGQDFTTTLVGIAMGGNTPGTAGIDNDNNKVENCSIQKVIFGIYSSGASATNQNIGTVISYNDLSATALNRIRRVGIAAFNEVGINVGYNSVSVDTSESADAIGITLGTLAVDTTAPTPTTNGGINGALVYNNKINGIKATSVNGYSSCGIAISGAAGNFNTIQNNMISGVSSPATAPDIPAGIFVIGIVGSDTRLYFNTVSMTGDRGSVVTQTPSYGIAITGVDPTVDFRNNIIYTDQIASGGGADAKSYAFGTNSTTFANLNSNYNDYISTGTQDGGFRSGSLGIAAGTDYASTAAWGTAIADETNSIEVVPVFISPTDLHLNVGSNSGLDNLGTTVSVANDFDCEVRSTTPDMGADEFSLLSVNNFNTINGLTAYPNPVNSLLNIKYINQISEISIFNMLGEEIFNKKINDDTAQIDMSSFNLGTYIVKVSSETGSNTIKVVKR